MKLRFANEDLRSAAKAKGVRIWQLAENLNISETTMAKLLRHELPNEKKLGCWQSLMRSPPRTVSSTTISNFFLGRFAAFGLRDFNFNFSGILFHSEVI